MISGVRSIVRMPVESVLQMLCTVNYVLNNEKLELRDINIYEHEQAELILRQERMDVRTGKTIRCISELAASDRS